MEEQPEQSFTSNPFRYQRVTEDAIAPYKHSQNSPYYTLCCPRSIEIAPLSNSWIPMNIKLFPPTDTYGYIFALPELSEDLFVSIGGGVIHEDSKDPIGITLFNHSPATLNLKRGTPFAGLIFKYIDYPILEELTDIDLPNTERGDKGFGSSGA